ncbi:MAG: DegT/DnrJ/EryC1/StrS family aminotransferase [Planctomycetaceae bacterium]|nr:DegT/DnrJ/EryC1/StrS family aminotransferase [Planctomycetaceae bacterium]
MSPKRNIPIAIPCFGDEEWQALREPLSSGWVTQGPKVAAFEKAFAQRQGAAHALACTSCTAGLHLILAAMGIGPGDEVIVPSFTWVASANAVLYCGATPVLCDVNRETFNIDIAHAASLVGPRTRAIIAVHLFGLSVDLDALAAAAPGVPLVSDAACAVATRYKGRPIGSLGTAAAFSFHPRKIIVTGEGGMVATQDAALAGRIDSLRNHGASVSEEQRHVGPKPYILPEFNALGFNYRMTDLQGAVGLAQLSRLDGFLEERRSGAEFYRRELASLGWLRTPSQEQSREHGWQAYVCYVDEAKSPLSRDRILEAMQAQGIGGRPGTHAVHMLGLYARQFGYTVDSLPAARDCYRYSLAIPLHNRMTMDDYRYVADALKNLE